MLLAHRIRLAPTPAQRDYFARAAGIEGRIPKGTRLPVSNNRSKEAKALARLHARIARVRADFLHKLTNPLCRENQAVVIEDLHVRGMLANVRLARAMAPSRRQWRYPRRARR